MNGDNLAFEAGHELNGQIKGRLSLLVKLGLLTTVKGGYLRVKPPVHPYGRQVDIAVTSNKVGTDRPSGSP